MKIQKKNSTKHEKTYFRNKWSGQRHPPPLRNDSPVIVTPNKKKKSRSVNDVDFLPVLRLYSYNQKKSEIPRN